MHIFKKIQNHKDTSLFLLGWIVRFITVYHHHIAPSANYWSGLKDEEGAACDTVQHNPRISSPRPKIQFWSPRHRAVGWHYSDCQAQRRQHVVPCCCDHRRWVTSLTPRDAFRQHVLVALPRGNWSAFLPRLDQLNCALWHRSPHAAAPHCRF